jgi:hypothetical protein
MESAEFSMRGYEGKGMVGRLTKRKFEEMLMRNVCYSHRAHCHNPYINLQMHLIKQNSWQVSKSTPVPKHVGV